MLKILKKYNNTNSFYFNSNDSLSKVCNAPRDKSGIYIVFEVKNKKEVIIYIGSSGKIQNDGSLKNRHGGLYDRLVNGHQFDKKPRRISWPLKMSEQNIDLLKISWFVTFDQDINDIPVYVESLLIQQYFEINKKLPRWNKEY